MPPEIGTGPPRVRSFRGHTHVLSRSIQLGILAIWLFAQAHLGAQPLAVSLVFPANGATNADYFQPIQWAPAPGAQAYYLYVEPRSAPAI